MTMAACHVWSIACMQASALLRVTQERDSALEQLDALRGMLVASGNTAGASAAGEVAALRARITDLERRNSELMQELRTVRRCGA